MNWVDFTIITVVVVSALVGLARGLVREALSLIVWITAVVVAWLFHRQVADLLTSQLSLPEVRIAVAFVGLVLVTLLLGALAGALLTRFIEKMGLTATDRVLGLAFGGARGVVIVAMTVFLVALTPSPTETWWQESALVEGFRGLAGWMLGLVPPELAAKLKQI